MIVLLLADIVTYSGVGNYIKMLSHKLVENGDTVILATGYCDLELSDKIKLVKLRQVNIRPDFLLFNLKSIRDLISKYGVEVVHVNHRMSAFLMKIYNLFFKHIPTIWTSHTAIWPMNPIKKMMGYYGDMSIAISTESKTFMQKELGIPENKIVTIYNGVEKESLRLLSAEERDDIKRRWQISADKIVIAVHGRIAYVKGMDFLVEVISRLSDKERSNLQIVCSGQYKDNEYYNRISNMISEKKLDDIFKFVGWCNSRDILGVSDLMILSSRTEGFALVAAESFLMEVPVIRTTTGGYEDMKDICVGVDYGDIDALLKEIISFLEVPNKYDGMVQKAKKKALDCFTVDTMFKSTYRIYNEMINRYVN